MKKDFTPATYMAKAERALEEAQLLLRDGKTEGSCSRAYYAMFDAAHAALLSAQIETMTDPIKSHHGLMLKINDLITTGMLDAELAKSISEVQFLRQLADYSSSPPKPADTKLAVEKAERFLAAIRAALVVATPIKKKKP